MYTKELLLGTIIIAGLFSSAYAKDKEVVGEVTMRVFGGGLLQVHYQLGSGRKVSQ